MKINVLITAVGSNTALSVIKGLQKDKNQQYRIVGCDTSSKYEIPGTSFCNTFYQVPKANKKEYIPTLLNICKKENIVAIIPIHDYEVEKISKYKNKFLKQNIFPCTSDHKTIKTCNDKYLTYCFLQSNDLEIPTIINNPTLEIVKRQFNYPVFVKPKRGCSSIDCYKVNSDKQLSVYLKMIKDPIVQTYLTGDKYVIDVLNDLNGNNIVSVPRIEYSSKAGIGVKAMTVANKELINYGKLISEKLQIKGAANIEVFLKLDKIYLIEINPRFSAGSILTTVSGVNIHSMLVSLFLNQKIDKIVTWKSGVYMTRYWDEIFYYKEKQFFK